MEKNIIELLEKNIERLDITNEKAIESIKKAISLVNDEGMQNKLNEKLDIKLNVNKKGEEKEVNEIKDVNFDLTLPKSITSPSKTTKNTANIKVLILAGAIAFSGIVGGITLANRPKNDEKDDISSSYSHYIDNNEVDNSEVVESNSEINSNILEENSTTIPDNGNTTYHYCIRDEESPEIEAMIQNLENEISATGIEKVEIHCMPREEMQELRKIPMSTWGSGQAYDMIAEMDSNHAFALLEMELSSINEAYNSAPIIEYAKEKNIDTEIFNQFRNYLIWYDSEFKGDSLYSEHIVGTPLYTMSEEQACRIEDLIGSIFTAMFNEKGYEEYYYVLDDIASINEKHQEYYNVTCRTQI